LPYDILRDRLIKEVEAQMDLDALAEVREIERYETNKLAEAMRTVRGNIKK
jgi:hypothetical protein